MIHFTFTVLGYSDDPAIGESLNVGVLLHAPDAHFLGLKVEENARRLSMAFPHFNGAQYRSIIRQISSAVESFEPSNSPQDVMAVALSLMPDQGLGFHWSPMRRGVTQDPVRELEYILSRFVPTVDLA